eukprot:TRINITY_DN4060_c0_g1_i3.p1 TRINITY_DN4060_c0_g1~~TRINITY_DN4060_c0_g1_i3.p1  ORF type:complete len:254 (+),score=41.32 TRINITY_DN4060_c0_g1_i3:202-963(+)
MRVAPDEFSTRKPARLTVDVVRSWRESAGVNQKSVFAAVKSAVCGPPGHHANIACKACGVDKVVTIVVDNHFPDTLSEGVERYLFSVKGLCTSTKKHLRDLGIVLAARFGNSWVESNPFSMRSRAQPKRPRSTRTYSPRSHTPVVSSPTPVGSSPITVAPTSPFAYQQQVSSPAAGPLICQPPQPLWQLPAADCNTSAPLLKPLIYATLPIFVRVLRFSINLTPESVQANMRLAGTIATRLVRFLACFWHANE